MNDLERPGSRANEWFGLGFPSGWFGASSGRTWAGKLLLGPGTMADYLVASRSNWPMERGESPARRRRPRGKGRSGSTEKRKRKKRRCDNGIGGVIGYLGRAQRKGSSLVNGIGAGEGREMTWMPTTVDGGGQQQYRNIHGSRHPAAVEKERPRQRDRQTDGQTDRQTTRQAQKQHDRLPRLFLFYPSNNPTPPPQPVSLPCPTSVKHTMVDRGVSPCKRVDRQHAAQEFRRW